MLYDLLNTKYLLGRKNVPLDTKKFTLAFDGDPGLNIFENTRAMPRAFVVFDVQAVSDHASALAAIHAPDFDPTQKVVLESDRLGQPITPVANASAEIVGYGPNEILVDAKSLSDGVLVLSEVYYPGWRAWIDDRPVDVLRADYLFRAIELPAGQHRVRFLYDPPLFKFGAGLFIVTLIALGAYCLWSTKVKRAARST